MEQINAQIKGIVKKAVTEERTEEQDKDGEEEEVEYSAEAVGYIYIFKNPSWEGYVKIGTTKGPVEYAVWRRSKTTVVSRTWSA
ncbi:hypothetical protein MMC08_001492 [Hypocenomyce scalaris]|nr:hypothetical protein [Hypocenomyce scalaris]